MNKPHFHLISSLFSIFFSNAPASSKYLPENGIGEIGKMVNVSMLVMER